MLYDVKCEKYIKTLGKFIFCNSKDYFTEYSSDLQCLWTRVKWCKKIEFFWHRNLQIFARYIVIFLTLTNMNKVLFYVISYLTLKIHSLDFYFRSNNNQIS